MGYICQYCKPGHEDHPAASIELINWSGSTNTLVDVAILDTGSPWTIVPHDALLLCDAGTNKLDVQKKLFVAGQILLSHPYSIRVKFCGVEQKGKVFSWGRDHALLGRDFLQYYHLEFNGPLKSVYVNRRHE
jgi:hypothetical protein